MPKGESKKEKMADVLFDIVKNSKQVPNYKYNEPSDLEKIRFLRPEFEYKEGKKRPLPHLRIKFSARGTDVYAAAFSVSLSRELRRTSCTPF